VPHVRPLITNSVVRPCIRGTGEPSVLSPCAGAAERRIGELDLVDPGHIHHRVRVRCSKPPPLTPGEDRLTGLRRMADLRVLWTLAARVDRP
jgi:hypothetical protein